MDEMRYMMEKIGEVERVVDINPTKRGEKALLFSEIDGDWIPLDGYLNLQGMRFLSHDELGSLDRALNENLRIRQKEVFEKEKSKKDWRGNIRE